LHASTKKKVADTKVVKVKAKSLWKNGAKRNGALENNMKKARKLLRWLKEPRKSNVT
jgi:hypothetical protein